MSVMHAWIAEFVSVQKNTIQSHIFENPPRAQITINRNSSYWVGPSPETALLTVTVEEIKGYGAFNIHYTIEIENEAAQNPILGKLRRFVGVFKPRAIFS